MNIALKAEMILLCYNVEYNKIILSTELDSYWTRNIPMNEASERCFLYPAWKRDVENCGTVHLFPDVCKLLRDRLKWTQQGDDDDSLVFNPLTLNCLFIINIKPTQAHNN